MKTKTQSAKYDPSALAKWTRSHRKEGKCFFNSVSIISLADKPGHGGRIHAKIEARFYGTGNMNFCCLWVNVAESPVCKCQKCGEIYYHLQTTCPKCVVPTLPGDPSPAVHTQGSSSAGGYGYHRPSAAFSEAARNAGFTLSNDVAGVGDEAVREALLAMAKTLKIKRPAIVESYQ